MVQLFQSDGTLVPMDPCHGHVGTFMKDGRGLVLKEAIKREQDAYEKLQGDAISEFVPGYFGVAHVNEGKKYLALRDVAAGLAEPVVMDCKMGIRTFLESDCANLIPREDLYKKMVKISPDLPTEAERSAEAVSKLRYMVVRETLSSSATLGFRIDGVGGGVEREAANGLQRVKSREEVTHMVAAYLARAVGESPAHRRKVVAAIVARLDELEEALRTSKFFTTHEMVGSSILFAVDREGDVALKIIDFAKCQELPEGVTTTHDRQWQHGNHEDGWLIGLRNLRSIWQTLMPAARASDDLLEGEGGPAEGINIGGTPPAGGANGGPAAGESSTSTEATETTESNEAVRS